MIPRELERHAHKKLEEQILRIENPVLRSGVQVLLGVVVGTVVTVLAIKKQQLRDARRGISSHSSFSLEQAAVGGAFAGGVAALILIARSAIKSTIASRKEQQQSVWWLHLLLFLCYFVAFIGLFMGLLFMAATLNLS
jgi:hypothetical protein